MDQIFLLLVSFAATGFFGYVAISPEQVPDAGTLLTISAIIVVLLSLAAYTMSNLADEYTFDGATVCCQGWRGKRKWLVPIDEISDVHVQTGRGGTFWSFHASGRSRVICVYRALAKAADVIRSGYKDA